MLRRLYMGMGCTLIAVTVATTTTAAQGKQPASEFDKTIAPVLAMRCLNCHRGKRPKGGLDLSQRKMAMEGGDSGVVLVPGDLKKSLLWKHVDGGRMPPKTPLPAAEKKLLARWIKSGAKWGSDPIDPFRITTTKRAGFDWWALQPIVRPEPPRVKQQHRVRTPIDAFVLAKLEAKGLRFAADAAPRLLIRRLYYDLIGLPPDPEDVESFVQQPTEKNYQRIVDKLLTSPHYGERWGRHWLDVVRFGESDGFERNNPRRNFWPYRDWVIQAFNDDMPYDEFARMQIAGDILRKGDAQGLSAVGFLVAGVHNTVVGSSERMKRLARQDELEEITGTMGQTFVGLTVNCARCHDHKFDPIYQREYYRLTAALAGVYHGERTAPTTTFVQKRQTLEKQITTLTEQIAKLDQPARQAVLQARKSGKAPAPKPPRPFAQWDFDKDLKDSIGQLHGKAVGNARLQNGMLIVDGRSHVETVPLTKNLAEKTLTAWVMLDDLNQRGGGVISVQTRDGRLFDAIVYGEREARRWMAGSNFFLRTQSFQGTAEQDARSTPVHIAIVYEADGTIRGYRNGKLYGRGYKSKGLQRFQAGTANVVFGLRHGPPGSNKMLRGKILKAQLFDRALSPQAVAAAAGVGNDYVSEQEILKQLAPAQQRQRQELSTKLAGLRKQQGDLQQRRQQKVYTVTPRRPGATHILNRGDVMKLGVKVTPGGIAAVKGLSPEFTLPPNADDAQRRLQLAQWLTAAKNPLFRRVIVNRLWHYHFGTGIVATPNDFGFNGSRPSHPHLLDWLATELQTKRYKLKAMHRLIVTSTVYRQATTLNAQAKKLDADNRLLWRRTPQRVDAEVLRDAMLYVSGALNPKRGGPGFEDVKIRPLNGTTYYVPFDAETPALNRRTVYRFTPRGGRSALLDTFDCPDPSATAPRRSVTTTPLQALSLLNNAFVLRMAKRFEGRVRKEVGTDVGKQVDRVFQLALGRPPEERERELAVRFVRSHGLAAVCRALFNCNEFVIVD